MWKDAYKSDMTEAGLEKDDKTNRAAWRKKNSYTGYSPLATRYPYIVNLAIMIRTRFFDGFGFP